MYSYIQKQWFEGTFNKWQIFRNSPGFANTNSYIESFNAAIKRDFTIRRRLGIIGSLEKFESIISFYSNNYNVFQLVPAFNPKIQKLTKSENLTKKNFKKVFNSRIIFSDYTKEFHISLKDDRCLNSVSCSCKYILK